ncbi:sporulation protein YyaC [Alicyclobacillus hesperidum URH17-3-68]|nr:sporulation protein YyaC [Alicyclobacillus hesperidum URH17-3-68]
MDAPFYAVQSVAEAKKFIDLCLQSHNNIEKWFEYAVVENG